MTYALFNDDSLELLKTFDADSIDSIVTDPPYGLSFMGNQWDYDVPQTELWAEVLRVLKPGGHLLSFAGSRTYHRMAVAIEDAGFEIRDQIMWVYGSGFPKSQNVGKKVPDYEGWGTALKPAHEPIVLARKPFKGSVAKNVLEHGTGALNIGASRIPCEVGDKPTFPEGDYSTDTTVGKLRPVNRTGDPDAGSRFPANFIHDGISEDWGRYFYCAKPSKKERNQGCEELPPKPKVFNGQSDKPSEDMKDVEKRFTTQPSSNNHPTVKPLKLMAYLCRLITPPGGIVLDPFMGSGSTGIAAINEGFTFWGIERESDYFTIAMSRIKSADASTLT